jgi:lysophospholipase L1-like esterase
MANVIIQGGKIAIKFNNGAVQASFVSVRPGMSEGELKSAVSSAIRSVAGMLRIGGKGAMADEALRASANIRALARQSGAKTVAPERPAARSTAPPRRAPSRPSSPRRTSPPRTTERIVPSARREARTARTAAGRSTPRPNVSGEWIELQMRESGKDDRKAKAAATTLHANREYVERLLSPTAQRGIERTDDQKTATIAVFKSLYTVPAFRFMLSSLAAQQQGIPDGKRPFPELMSLQSALGALGAAAIGKQAKPELFFAADLYIRYFLYGFVASNPNFSRFAEEVGPLPKGGSKLANIRRLRDMISKGLEPATKAEIGLLRLQLVGAMDADTVTAASLYIRRWTLEHPTRGKGRTQDRIDVWKAPQVAQLQESERPVAERPVARQTISPVMPRINAPAPGVRPTPGGKPFRVGVIGDSITSGGRYARTLQDILRRGNPGTAVDAYGVSGQTILEIQSRFRRQVLGKLPPYDTVVIQGGVNKIRETRLEDAQLAFAQMVKEATARGMKVVILAITPWATSKWTTDLTQMREAQTKTQMMNVWLKNLATADGKVVIVDTSILGERSPVGPMLKKAYDSGDGLHPNNLGKDIIARLIAQHAFNVSATGSGPVKDPLVEFADKYWKSLTDTLARAVKEGRPADVVDISKKLPEGQPNLETALRTLKRDDISRAYDRVFNDFLKYDAEYALFCKTSRQFRNIVNAGVRLSPESRDSDRRLVARSMKEFLNHSALQKDDTHMKLGEDLKKLYVDVLKLGKPSLFPDPSEDIKTLAAVAVYKWRMTPANKNAPVGEWGKTLGLSQQTQPPRTVPGVAPGTKPEEEEGRRRVFRLR